MLTLSPQHYEADADGLCHNLVKPLLKKEGLEMVSTIQSMNVIRLI